MGNSCRETNVRSVLTGFAHNALQLSSFPEAMRVSALISVLVSLKFLSLPRSSFQRKREAFYCRTIYMNWFLICGNGFNFLQ